MIKFHHKVNSFVHHGKKEANFSRSCWKKIKQSKRENLGQVPLGRCAFALGKMRRPFHFFNKDKCMLLCLNFLSYQVLHGLESATNCVEDMDEWLGIFNVKLRHMREDIESVRISAWQIVYFIFNLSFFLLIFFMARLFDLTRNVYFLSLVN